MAENEAPTMASPLETYPAAAQTISHRPVEAATVPAPVAVPQLAPLPADSTTPVEFPAVPSSGVRRPEEELLGPGAQPPRLAPYPTASNPSGPYPTASNPSGSYPPAPYPPALPRAAGPGEWAVSGSSVVRQPAAGPPVGGQLVTGSVAGAPPADVPPVDGPVATEPGRKPRRTDFMSWLRTPVVAVIAGGVLLLGVGFGTGFVVGRDHAGTAATAGVQGGPGGMPGGGTGFGGGPGGQAQDGQTQGGVGPNGFGGPSGQTQPGLGGQSGTDGSIGTDGSTGTADTTGATDAAASSLAQSQ